MKNVLLIGLMISIFACKTDKKTEPTTTTVDGITKIIAADPSTLTVPESCNLITAEDIKNILGVPAGSINVKNADDKDKKGNRSCFFQWDDPATPNAGIMINVMTNPVYAEAQDYFTLMIKSKLEHGETEVGQDKADRFSKFDAGTKGIGAYNFRQSRFYWNRGNDYMFMLAFNMTTLTEKKMVSVAEEIVAKVNANFDSSVK
jgi:hypothetical protein